MIELKLTTGDKESTLTLMGIDYDPTTEKFDIRFSNELTDMNGPPIILRIPTETLMDLNKELVRSHEEALQSD